MSVRCRGSWLGAAAIVVLLSTATVSPAIAELRVGVASAEIVAPEDWEMWGYTPRPNRGVLDPLLARVVLFDAGEEKVALVTLDLGRTPAKTQMDRVRAAVRERAEVDDVLFNASHTHSGPYLRDVYEDGVPEWELRAMDAIADAVVEAAAGTFPARLGVGYGRVEIGHNRRYLLPDGSVRMLWANPTRVATHPVDPEVTVIRIDDAEGRTRALVVGYACHPVIFGPDNLEYSADFPGAMAATVRAAHPDRPLVAFLQGGAGDINPFDDKRELPADAVRLMREAGAALGREVLRVAETIAPRASPAPTIELHREEWVFQHRLDPRDEYRGDLTVLLLDDSIGMIGLPGEPFVEFQLDLKRRRPVEHVLFLGFTNGYVGYFPTVRAAAEGGYGADPTVARVDLGAGERMTIEGWRRLLEMSEQLGDRPEAPE